MAMSAAWQRAQRLESHKQVLHHSPSHRKVNKNHSEIWSWLLRCAGAGPQVQGQQQWELLTPASPLWDQGLQLHSLTAARTWATPDPSRAGQPPGLSGGNRALGRASGSEAHFKLQPECVRSVTHGRHCNGQSSSVLLRGSTQAPGACWENMRELSQLAWHWTLISLHIPLLLQHACFTLPWHCKGKGKQTLI